MPKHPNPIRSTQDEDPKVTKTITPLETMITQLANAVEDAHLFNSSALKTGSTNPRKQRRRAKRNVTKTRTLFEATFTQLTNTVGDAHLFNSTLLETVSTNPLK